MKNLILIGYMGCGKTTIGKQFAKSYDYKFCDTDYLIEKHTKTKISDIFASKGEAYFRNLETHTLETIQGQLKQTVLSTGGGMPCREENVNLLQSIGTVIYLKVSKETLLHRLKEDTTRPLLQGDNLEAKVEEMLMQRNPLYEKAANYVIDTDNHTPKEVAEIIYELMREESDQ